MSEKMMDALVKTGPVKGLTLKQVPVPTPGPGEVLIKIHKTAICGTDVHIYNWDPWSQANLNPPLVTGHEYVGEIAEVGPGANKYHVGQRVTGEGHIICGVEGLLRGDYASRMSGYATARQNGWMSANDIRELENMDRIPAEEGGDLYLINGNMLPLGNAGAFANTETSNDGKEENPDEEVLEVEEPGGDGDSSGGTDAVPQRHHRRGKLV